MASNKELYDLIKTLTSPEKRYLKKLMKALAGNKQKKYQDHFDKIVAMKKFDDLLWVRKMGLNASKKQVKETNNYLYDFILRGLIMFTSARDKTKNKVLVESQKIHILQQKGLYETTLHRINDLIELCEEQQFFDLALHLVNEKRSVSFGLGLFSGLNDEVFKIYDTFDIYLDQAGNVNDYLRLVAEMKRVLNSNEVIRSPEIEEEFTSILKHKLLQNSVTATNLRSKNLYFILKIIFVNALYLEEEAISLSDESIEFFAEKSKVGDPLYLGFMLNKRLEIAAVFDRWKEFGYWYDRFMSMPKTFKYHTAKRYWFLNGHRHKLRWIYACRDLEEFALLEKDFDKEFYEECRGDGSGAFYETEYVFAKVLHLAGRYDDALTHIDSILDNRQRVRNDLLLATRVLHLIIHYDLNNVFYVPYAVQSLYRVLLKAPTDYKAEHQLVLFLKKAVNVTEKDELRDLMSKLLTIWEEMKKDKYQREFFWYFPYCEWITSKLEDRDFLEVLKIDPPCIS
ncbi:MAG: hypothetical protein GY751_16600 [Bacteroidetes bacterium]|nr:hypothetical protein [Bacteroidota bacterium]